SNVGAVSVKDIPVQSFTINSDSQITALASLPDVGTPPNDVQVRTFLTSTALPAEFANTGFPLFIDQLELDAVTGASRPGTPTYSTAILPAVPRITGVVTNQGPSIAAPSRPSQVFTNPAIH